MTRQKRIAEMKRLRDKKRMTLREIGETFNLSRERVRQLIGNTGHLHNSDRLRQNIEEVRDRVYYDEDVTVEQVAHQYHLSESTVRKILEPRWKYLMSLGLRRCYICHNIKPIDEFGVANKRYKQMKISGICKECNSANSRYYYQLKKPKSN